MEATREEAMRRALELLPGSILALSRESGVSARLLRMIRDGERSATPVVTEAVAAALERLGARHEHAARILRDALRATRGANG
jgi:hypothetical protein